MAGVVLHGVVMGVAGCGKSAVGRRMAAQLGLPLIEGDDFHPPGNVHKMQQGIPLTDEDRAAWLTTLAGVLHDASGGAVLSCSALKRAYRDRLRPAVSSLRFVYLDITRAESLRRVAARAGHFYPPSLVASQFEALESPSGEAGVLTLDASQSLDRLAASASDWLRSSASLRAG
jgi:gluconokinase